MSNTPHEVGTKVTHLKPGDRVALEPGAVCDLCHECKTGKYEVSCSLVVTAYTGCLRLR